jgi:hypothetical protein
MTEMLAFKWSNVSIMGTVLFTSLVPTGQMSLAFGGMRDFAQFGSPYVRRVGANRAKTMNNQWERKRG